MKEGKTFKRVLAIALVVVMAMTMVPFGAFATEGTGDAPATPAVCEHAFEKASGYVAPNCTEAGNDRYYKCSKCNVLAKDAAGTQIIASVADVTIAATGHKGGTATCTAKAVCTACGQAYGETLAHDWNAATCTAPKSCKNCTTTEGTTIAHNFGTNSKCLVCGADCPHSEKVTVPGNPATCTRPGLSDAEKCKACGNVTKAHVQIDPLNHPADRVTTDNGTPATCTAAGTSAGKYCAACETWIEGHTPIAQLGHDYAASASKKDDLQHGKKCSRCGDYKDAANHTWELAATLTAPSCTTKGQGTYECTGCEASKTDDIAKAAHVYATVMTKKDDAKHGYKCTTCDDYKDLADHTYTTVEKHLATCSATGTEKKKCTVCNDEKTEILDIDATAHKYGAYEVVTAASCTTAGSKRAVCTLNSAHVDTVEIPAEGHNGVATAAKAANCKEAGNIAYWTCRKCNKIFKDEACLIECTLADTIIAKGEHVYGTYTLSADATCTAHAKETAKCTICNEATHTRDIPATMIAHSFKNYVSNNDATCIADGTMSATCEMCNTAKDDKPDVGSKDRAPHKPNADGTKCELCGAELVCLHTYSGEKLITVTPTCTTDGEKANICSKCNEKKPGSAEKIAALGHNWDVGTVTTEPTCEKKGVKTFKCTNAACTETKTEDVAIVEHDYDKEIVQPTCEEDGYTTFTCKMCKSSYIGDKTDKYGHSYVTYVADEGSATCYADGTKTAECDHGCGKKSTVADEGSKIDHKLTDFAQTKAPDCVNEGEEEAKCFYYDKCGYSELVPIDALGHDEPAEFTVVTPATCTAKGLQTKTCTRCPEVVKSEEIAPLGHTITDATAYTVDVAPTCTEKGSESKHCERCTYTEGSREIAALDHDYQPGAGTEATCEKGGKAHYTCTRCAHAYTVDDGPALGHDFQYVSNGDATCTEDGTKTGKCSRCEKVDTIADVDSKLGHTAGTPEVTPATMDADGEISTKCTVCDVEIESEPIDKIASISLKYTVAVYNGESKRPLLTITDAAGNVLTKDEDYKVVLPTKAESAEIGTHSYKITFIGNYEGEEELTYQVVPGKPNKIISKGTKQSYISLKWSNVKGADGYRVYVKNANGKWKTLATVTGTNVYKADKLEAGKKYEFAVKAFAKTDEGTIWAKEFTEMSFTTLPTKTSKVTYTAKKTIAKLTWKEVKNADGYRIYVYDSKTEKYKTVATVKNGKTTYTVSDLKAGTTYKFAVKAYVKDGDTTIWSNQYTAVKVTTKK